MAPNLGVNGVMDAPRLQLLMLTMGKKEGVDSSTIGFLTPSILLLRVVKHLIRFPGFFRWLSPALLQPLSDSARSTQ